MGRQISDEETEGQRRMQTDIQIFGQTGASTLNNIHKVQLQSNFALKSMSLIQLMFAKLLGEKKFWSLHVDFDIVTEHQDLQKNLDICTQGGLKI